MPLRLESKSSSRAPLANTALSKKRLVQAALVLLQLVSVGPSHYPTGCPRCDGQYGTKFVFIGGRYWPKQHVIERVLARETDLTIPNEIAAIILSYAPPRCGRCLGTRARLYEDRFTKLVDIHMKNIVARTINNPRCGQQIGGDGGGTYDLFALGTGDPVPVMRFCFCSLHGSKNFINTIRMLDASKEFGLKQKHIVPALLALAMKYREGVIMARLWDGLRICDEEHDYIIEGYPRWEMKLSEFKKKYSDILQRINRGGKLDPIKHAAQQKAGRTTHDDPGEQKVDLIPELGASAATPTDHKPTNCLVM